MKVSIIIPVYNSEKYIGKCLDHLLNQTYQNFEIICINDGSKDNSLEILKKYSQKDKRIIVLDQTNKGIAKTRNIGIQKANGDYIMFVDNDDYMDKDYLRVYVDNTENGKYDIVIGGYKRIDNEGKLLNRQVLNSNSNWSKYIVTAPWAKIYKKTFILNNKITFLNYVGEDIYFNLKCYSSNPKIKIIKNDGYVWFYNNDSFSNTNKNKGTKSNINIIKLLEYLKEAVDMNDIYVKYFMKRYVVWYLTFLGENSSKNDIKKEYDKLTEWLKDNDVNKTINPLSMKLKGEKLKNRLAVLLYDLTKKTHTQDLFIKLISRG